VGAAFAVIFFGSGPAGGREISNALLVLALGAGLLVWNLTRPGNGKPVN
jgi:hypothetical protein